MQELVSTEELKKIAASKTQEEADALWNEICEREFRRLEQEARQNSTVTYQDAIDALLDVTIPSEKSFAKFEEIIQQVEEKEKRNR